MTPNNNLAPSKSKVKAEEHVERNTSPKKAPSTSDNLAFGMFANLPIRTEMPTATAKKDRNTGQLSPPKDGSKMFDNLPVRTKQPTAATKEDTKAGPLSLSEDGSKMFHNLSVRTKQPTAATKEDKKVVSQEEPAMSSKDLRDMLADGWAHFNERTGR